MSELSHFDNQGRAIMVDVSKKKESVRVAIAHSSIEVNKNVYEQIKQGTNKKGDVFGVARVAGIMATKQTSNIIPMCHPIPITGVTIDFNWQKGNNTDHHLVHITATVKTVGVTGVEMEALTGASAAALTIYDMCKAVDKSMTIGPTYLQHKSGGASGDFNRDEVNSDN